jgi:hypothetical protein
MFETVFWQVKIEGSPSLAIGCHVIWPGPANLQAVDIELKNYHSIDIDMIIIRIHSEHYKVTWVRMIYQKANVDPTCSGIRTGPSRSSPTHHFHV